MALLTPEILDTKTYTFNRVRQLLADMGIQEGVVGANDLKVVQRGAGANMSVDVGAGACFIQGDDTAYQGLYHVINDATANVVVGAAHASLPRIDQLVLEVNDSTAGQAGDNAVFTVVAGAATGGATLDNRTGATALPATAIRLADILVPAASSSVVTANIRDRRPWARGFAYSYLGATGGNYSVAASGSFANLDSTNMAPRLELGNVNNRIIVRAQLPVATIGTGVLSVAAGIDGALGSNRVDRYSATGGVTDNFNYDGPVSAAAGSHIVSLAINTTAGTWTVYRDGAGSGRVALFQVYEELRPNASNT